MSWYNTIHLKTTRASLSSLPLVPLIRLLAIQWVSMTVVKMTWIISLAPTNFFFVTLTSTTSDVIILFLLDADDSFADATMNSLDQQLQFWQFLWMISCTTIYFQQGQCFHHCLESDWLLQIVAGRSFTLDLLNGLSCWLTVCSIGHRQSAAEEAFCSLTNFICMWLECASGRNRVNIETSLQSILFCRAFSGGRLILAAGISLVTCL